MIKTKYKKGDCVRLKRGHSEGDTVVILEVLPSGDYKIYIPYWDYFTIDDDDIIELVSSFTATNAPSQEK